MNQKIALTNDMEAESLADGSIVGYATSVAVQRDSVTVLDVSSELMDDGSRWQLCVACDTFIWQELGLVSYIQEAENATWILTKKDKYFCNLNCA